METLATDNPGDCQAVAADSTTTTTTAVVASSEQRSGPRTRSSTLNSEDVSSTTSAASATATSSSSATTKQGAATPPPTTTNAHANNNNNNNKIKSQQQQLQQQQQKFQFRAPQQFVKHRKATSMLAKKNKTWNKRQNKCHLQKQQQQQVTSSALTAGGIVSGLGLAGAVSGIGSTKADLENIQNLKNQLGSGGHHHQYHHHHHHSGHHGGGGGGGRSGGSNANGIAPCLCALEKLGYGHGHLKQQLYKKMLAHRGHHHHVLCAGAAHNASGGGGGGSGGGGTNSACCLINGCSIQNGKDSTNSNSHNNSSHANITHYCCGRSKFFLPDKRPRKEVIIPPTKFLLGGTISDPLNLNSLQNESASNVSSNNNTPATTPRQSPITTPPKVEVIIPPNIYDPLHLLDPVDSMEYEKQLTSPMKRKTKASTKKHRHRKNRKPKRRRYESYNSTTLEDDALSLTGSSTATANTSLVNSTLLTDNSSASNTNSMSISLSLASLENTSVGGGVSSANVDEEQHNEEKHNSPAPPHGSEQIGLSSAASEQVEKNNSALSPNKSQQHVANNLMGESVGGAVDMLNVRRTSERERVSKDLRLDLSMCGIGASVVGSVGGNNHNNNSNNHSASSSTCGSAGTTLGSAGLSNSGGGCSSGGGGGGGGRKRKISESSNSQKNKKFHRVDSMDKIVSPVVPQPGAWKRPPRLVPTGARKSSRRSTSVSENELLSPADETNKTINDSESNRGDTPDLSKMIEPISEAAIGSPLSTASGATSVTAGEQDSMPELGVGETTTQTATITVSDSVTATNKPNTTHNTIAQLTKMPKFRADGAKYQYGNYDRYAGFLHLNEFMDVRLQVFQRHLELFKNKDILDIGCNVGHMTITVARSLAPKSILGIDIDKELIARARRNLSMYVRIPAETKAKQEIKPQNKQENTDASGQKSKRTRRQKKKKQQQTPSAVNNTTSHVHHHHHHHHLIQHHHQQHLTSKMHVDAAEFFPISFPINYGGMPDLTCAATPSISCGTPGNTSGSCAAPNNSSGISGGSGGGGSTASKSKIEFPKNVFFRHCNYVLKDEALLNNDTQQYDLILCLSLTKWIHLNFGDNGLKMAFKRMFNQLRPGGKLILEAQNWASYKKKKNLTEQIYNNYSKIEFFPNKFHEYLLSPEVGFSHSYTLGAPRHLNKGFSRPIQLYAKGDYTPNHVRWSDAYYPQTPYEAYRGIYATMAPHSHHLMSSTRSQNYDTPHHPGIGGGGGGGGGGPGSGSYSCRQTPMHQPTSQYYNPLETDSYLPSYDMEYLNHLYVFASPLYQTVWSPPASLRNSSTHTPLYGSVRDVELDGDIISGGSAGGGSYHRHVYPPNDDTSSPNANAGGAFSSIRDPDTDDSNQLPANSVQHVYATNCESSSSPQVLHPHESETIDVSLMLADETGVNGDSNEA